MSNLTISILLLCLTSSTIASAGPVLSGGAGVPTPYFPAPQPAQELQAAVPITFQAVAYAELQLPPYNAALQALPPAYQPGPILTLQQPSHQIPSYGTMPQGNTVTLFIGQLPAHWNAEMVHNMLTHLFGPGNYHVIKNQYRSNIAFVTVSVSVVRYMVSGTLHYVVEGNNVWLLSNYRATGGTFQAMTIEIARRHS